MVTKTEGIHAGEFVLSQANGERSREAVTVALGQQLTAGQVLARVAVAGAIAAAAAADNTGNGTVGSLAVGSEAQEGEYRITCIDPALDGGTFQVEDPAGVVIGTAVVGTPFADQIGFALSDGATDFAAGDAFVVTVSGLEEQWKAFHQDGTDGTHVASGVLYDDCDAVAAAQRATAVVRDAEVNGHALTWPADITAEEKDRAVLQLATAGLIVRL